MRRKLKQIYGTKQLQILEGCDIQIHWYETNNDRLILRFMLEQNIT